MITVMVIVLMVTIMIMVVMMVMVVMTMVLVLKITLSDTCSNGFAAADNDQHESDIFNDSVDGNEDTGKIMEFFITEPTMGVGWGYAVEALSGPVNITRMSVRCLRIGSSCSCK